MLITNRRDAIRMGTWIPCGIRYDRLSQLDRWGVLVDFSVTGGQLKSYFSFSRNQKTLLSFSVNDRHMFINLQGEIIWVQKDNEYNMVGLKFSPNNKEKILTAMRYLIDPVHYFSKS